MQLDNDGNATVIVLGGPSCAAGESLISAHMEAAPYTTATTGFTVLPPRPSPAGVFVHPRDKVEGEELQRRGDDRPGRVPARVRRGSGEHQRLAAVLALPAGPRHRMA